MCGIGLLVRGIALWRPSLISTDPTQLEHSQNVTPSEGTNATEEKEEEGEGEALRRWDERLQHRGPDHSEVYERTIPPVTLRWSGHVLRLRGPNVSQQPARDAAGNVLCWNGEVLGFNIELFRQFFSHWQQSADSQRGANFNTILASIHSLLADGTLSDTDWLLRTLAMCTTPHEVSSLLRCIEGPWALLYWHQSSCTLWFGRDPFGRRSLLVALRIVSTLKDTNCISSHLSSSNAAVSSATSLLSAPSSEVISPMNHRRKEERVGTFPSCVRSAAFHSNTVCNALYLSSVSVPIDSSQSKQFLSTNDNIWHEVETSGLFALQLGTKSKGEGDVFLTGDGIRLLHYRWNAVVASLYSPLSSVSLSNANDKDISSLCMALDGLLSDSVSRRVHLVAESCPIAILFSGGLDSTLLAYYTHRHLPSSTPIDLINVAFPRKPDHFPASTTTSLEHYNNNNLDGSILRDPESFEDAPDRKSARQSLRELRTVCSGREWRLIEVNVCPEHLWRDRSYIESLIVPTRTVMDFTIGAALWYASGTKVSEARVLLLGTGADEWFAGYGRYRTAFKRGGLPQLIAELTKDRQRLWLRNLGRDDRVIADHGREARFPFLDEKVTAFVSQIPVSLLADFSLPPGVGEKKLLRQIAQQNGLTFASRLAKRAIQFGSNIAKQFPKQTKGTDFLDDK